ncbi:hypothetical protein E2C01_032065 [Portunus trituberculatus]|uniref:Uncharacterized protein n=1 Tax=Portunus trituberculatus TaxID=210409 RepID=A0A5B7EZK4_PORTR|nr:hypothetical protein [Portunus trituberculatus]
MAVAAGRVGPDRVIQSVTPTLQAYQHQPLVCIALLLPRLFSKATEMTSWVFKSVSPVNNVEMLLICH